MATHMKFRVWNRSFATRLSEEIKKSRWWFQIFFMFTTTWGPWGRFPFWLLFSNGSKPPSRNPYAYMDTFFFKSVHHTPNRLPIDGLDHQTIAANGFLLDYYFFYVSSNWLVQRFKVGYWYVQFGQEVYWHWCIGCFYLPLGRPSKSRRYI